jgi:hypothetical protein
MHLRKAAAQAGATIGLKETVVIACLARQIGAAQA